MSTLINKVINDITVVSLVNKIYGTSNWKCKCNKCGRTFVVKTEDLFDVQCNCKYWEQFNKENTRYHGYSQTEGYRYWKTVIQRCKRTDVEIDPRWLDYRTFLQDMGERPKGMVLNRKNLIKGLFPDNVEWVTKDKYERLGTTDKRGIIVYKDEGHTLEGWARITGIDANTIAQRYDAGYRGEWLFVKALPKGPKNYKLADSPTQKQIKTQVQTIGNIAYGTLVSGEKFLVDKQDIPVIEPFTWRLSKGGYAETSVKRNGITKRFFMHRLIMNATDLDWKKFPIDHKNGNKLDNTTKNLRICTPSDNQINRDIRSDNTSGFTGVHREGDKWVTTINGKRIKGSCGTLEEAIKKRKEMERLIYGEFSKFFEDE